MNRVRTLRRSQRGVTLIELMIAVTIGLALTIVVASLFLHSRATYGTTDDLSRMQENIRYSQDLLTRVVHHASYITSPNSIKDDDSIPTGSGVISIFNNANLALTATDGAGTASDRFTVRFQGSGTPADGTITDCQGNAIADNQISVNTFSIGVGLNGGPALMCDIGAGAVEVVPDVENMQLVFGEDTSNPRDGSAERFVSIGQVSSQNAIIALRIALLFRTPNIQTNVVQDTTQYNLLGVTLPAFNDTRVRRLVIMTINLRNRSR